jgi:hypothetical protein
MRDVNESVVAQLSKGIFSVKQLHILYESIKTLEQWYPPENLEHKWGDERVHYIGYLCKYTDTIQQIKATSNPHIQ